MIVTRAEHEVQPFLHGDDGVAEWRKDRDVGGGIGDHVEDERWRHVHRTAPRRGR